MLTHYTSLAPHIHTHKHTHAQIRARFTFRIECLRGTSFGRLHWGYTAFNHTFYIKPKYFQTAYCCCCCLWFVSFINGITLSNANHTRAHPARHSHQTGWKRVNMQTQINANSWRWSEVDAGGAGGAGGAIIRERRFNLSSVSQYKQTNTSLCVCVFYGCETLLVSPNHDNRMTIPSIRLCCIYVFAARIRNFLYENIFIAGVASHVSIKIKFKYYCCSRWRSLFDAVGGMVRYYAH